MNTPNADISYAPDTVSGEVTFTAHTLKGEEWMGSAELCHPEEDADEFVQAAKDAGLIITMTAPIE